MFRAPGLALLSNIPRMSLELRERSLQFDMQIHPIGLVPEGGDEDAFSPSLLQ